MTKRQPSRIFGNMKLATEHAEALAAYDRRPPEYVYATVEVKVLREAIAFLRKMGGHANGETTREEK